jgi:hypothetical protein
VSEEGRRRYLWRGRDVSRSLFAFLEAFWPSEAVEIDDWQLRILEGFVRGARTGRAVSMGTPAGRSDGWLRRATEALRNLEREADQDLAD